MDWITTSGSSLHEAKSNALDQLGIVADDAEFDIINDVEKGLFGRVKTAAKVRARVRPKQPVVKEDSRRRRSGNGGDSGGSRARSGQRDNKRGNKAKDSGGGGQRQGRGGSPSKPRDRNKSEGKKPKSQSGSSSRPRDQKSSNRSEQDSGNRKRERGAGQNGNGGSDGAEKTAAPAGARQQQTKKDTVDHDFTREQQVDVAVTFLKGLLDSFDIEGTVGVVDEPAEDDAIELTVTGSELGLLVGQKGVTLNAVQELTRTVVQREADGAKTERLRVDVAGYRERRSAALQGFARKIAEDVIESGQEKVLEPMGPADRKVVHDALTDFEGVETGSEGEEPRRRVVIRPS